MTEPRAAYIHVPFCRHRCGYCNFAVIAGRDDLIEQYLHGLQQELSALGHPREVDTLFLGGGTPTHLPPAQLERLLQIAHKWFPLAVGGELSVEANPADLDSERVDVLGRQGVTRVSLGAQSFDPDKLRLLERDHQPEDIARSVELARSAVQSVSLDLIFGTPGESLSTWMADLSAALALRPEHVSTYGLTYERGTRFWGRLSKGQLSALGEEPEREMYALAIDKLSAAGFEHYEVSNFARPGHRCRHNEVYWAASPYYAAGPGAARYVHGRREVNHRSTWTWLKRVLAGQSPVAESEELSPEDRAREALVLGLRRIEGIDQAAFAVQTGFELHRLVGRELQRHLDLGTLEMTNGQLRLTRNGLFVSDAIWPDFLRT
ncbi:MAG: radical SAM family heme chaperone HemW [Planctomycetes bacterium]|nr:radical SAM family heme chaperone HemW [Planctomycetota bacterium]